MDHDAFEPYVGLDQMLKRNYSHLLSLDRLLRTRHRNTLLLLSVLVLFGLAMTLSSARNTTFVQKVDAMHDQEDPENTNCQNDFIYPTNPVAVAYNQFSRLRLPVGNQIETGIQFELTTVVKEACGHIHPAWIIIEVRDSNDVTIFLGIQMIEQMQPYSITEVGVSWNAPEEPGIYEIRAFTLVNFQTSGFGRVATSNIEVVLPQE